mgnify:CR=1 FL=1
MRTYTALYDTAAEAERVQAELERLGIIDADDRRVHAGELGDDAFDGGRGVAPPEPDRRLYKEGVKRGGALLTVNVQDQYADEALRLIEGSNPVDLEAREAEYRNAGYLQDAAPAVAAAGAATQLAGEEHIPVVEERLVVGKREVERGGLRVRSYVREIPVEEQVRLREEHVEIERRPVGERLTGASADAFREREFEVTERAEEAVVAKEARVIEEVVVRKEETDHVEEIEDTVRRTEVEVDRIDAERRI